MRHFIFKVILFVLKVNESWESFEDNLKRIFLKHIVDLSVALCFLLFQVLSDHLIDDSFALLADEFKYLFNFYLLQVQLEDLEIHTQFDHQKRFIIFLKKIVFVDYIEGNGLDVFLSSRVDLDNLIIIC